MSDFPDSTLVALVVGLLTGIGGLVTAWASKRKTESDHYLTRAQATSTYAAIDQMRLTALEADLKRARTDADYQRQERHDAENRVRMWRKLAEGYYRQVMEHGGVPFEELPNGPPEPEE